MARPHLPTVFAKRISRRARPWRAEPLDPQFLLARSERTGRRGHRVLLHGPRNRVADQDACRTMRHDAWMDRAAPRADLQEDRATSTVTQHDRFPHRTFHGVDPPGLTWADYAVDTARMWTLHLPVAHPVAVEAVLKRLRARGAECLTGHSCGGDSWGAWAEVHTSGPRALHVYFTAPDESTAAEAARLMSAQAGVPLEQGTFVLSTAGDWGEQSDMESRAPSHVGVG